MMESVFLRLLDMSLLSSYCVIIVLLIRLLLRKSPEDLFLPSADANLAVCQFAVRWYYDYANMDSTAAPLETRYTDSALVIYDAGNLAGDDYFLISYLSGKSVIHAKIYVETQRLQDFFTSMVNLGIPFPDMALNQHEITWPHEAVPGSSADFLTYLTQRGYNAYESPNFEGYFHGESDDLIFKRIISRCPTRTP